MKLNENDIRGSLYGFAIGDAMGATTEFLTKNQVKKWYGKVDKIVGGGWLKLKAGQVTDDTEMMFCVADALCSADQSKATFYSDALDLCCTNFINWYKSGPIDIGNACRKAIDICQKFGSNSNLWMYIVEDQKHLNKGNGSLMRCLFACLWELLTPGLLPMFSVMQGKLTHNNVVCSDAIRTYYSALATITGELCQKPYINIIEKISALKQPTGLVGNTLNNAIYYLKHCSTFEESIIEAVNNGGDADTIAALTGGLTGLKFGFDSIPSKWIKRLDKDVKRKLNIYTENLCERFKI